MYIPVLLQICTYYKTIIILDSYAILMCKNYNLICKLYIYIYVLCEFVITDKYYLQLQRILISEIFSRSKTTTSNHKV